MKVFPEFWNGLAIKMLNEGRAVRIARNSVFNERINKGAEPSTNGIMREDLNNQSEESICGGDLRSRKSSLLCCKHTLFLSKRFCKNVCELSRIVFRLSVRIVGKASEEYLEAGLQFLQVWRCFLFAVGYLAGGADRFNAVTRKGLLA